jgi:hypothetical protein
MIGAGRPGLQVGRDQVSDRSTRKLVALLGAAVVLVIAGWVDTVVMVGIHRTSSATFDIIQIAWAVPFGYLTIAAAILVIGLLARWARSVLVGLAYALIGAFLAFLFPINWLWTAETNGAPPILPAPVATFVNEVYSHAEQGPLNAVAIIGAGMLLVGLASIGYELRHPVRAVPGGVEGPLQAEVSPG